MCSCRNPLFSLVCSYAAFFDDYTGVARIASAAFMILQIIIILDYACALGKAL